MLRPSKSKIEYYYLDSKQQKQVLQGAVQIPRDSCGRKGNGEITECVARRELTSRPKVREEVFGLRTFSEALETLPIVSP